MARPDRQRAFVDPWAVAAGDRDPAEVALSAVGRIVALAVRPARRAPMMSCQALAVRADGTLEGGGVVDHKGVRLPERAITLMAAEDWSAALSELSLDPDAPPPPWTVRRANVLIEGLRLPRAREAILDIGPSVPEANTDFGSVRLEITRPTSPCRRMDEAVPGLLRSLAPGWRGGVTARVLVPVPLSGRIHVGDTVRIQSSPPERQRRLP